MYNKNNIIHSTILHFYIPFVSTPHYSIGYEPGFVHSSNTFILQLQLHPQRFSWFPRFSFALEFYGQYSHSKEGYLASIPKHSLSITVDKSCRHRMHFHSKIPSSFLHSLFPISVDEIASLFPSLLPCYKDKHLYVYIWSYYHIWH